MIWQMKIRKLGKRKNGRAATLAVMTGGILVAGVSMGVGSKNVRTQGTRKSTAPPVMAHGKMGQDLFLAIDHRDTKEV